jgi:hypothetical protein
VGSLRHARVKPNWMYYTTVLYYCKEVTYEILSSTGARIRSNAQVSLNERLGERSRRKL